jgi:RHS repeat-associated protein
MRHRINLSLALTLSFVMAASPVLIAAPNRSPRKTIPSPRSEISHPLSGRVKRIPGQPRQNTAQPQGQTTTQLPDGRLLLIGGMAPDGPLASVTINNPINGESISLPDMPLRRGWHSATMLPDGRVLIIGGIGANGQISDSVQIFDPDTRGFETLPKTGLSPRAYHSATLLTDGRVLVVGGESREGRPAANAEVWDFRTKGAQNLPDNISVARQQHKATLLSDGNVLIEGGIDQVSSPAQSAELFNVETGSFSFTSISSSEINGNPTFLAASIPRDSATKVSLDSIVTLRFSTPRNVASINSDTVKLSENGLQVPAKVIPAEHGRLAFVIPLEPLHNGTTYTVVLEAPKDEADKVTPATLSFTTIGDRKDEDKQRQTNQPITDADWLPDAESLRGNWKSKLGRSSWQDQEPLKARTGETAVSGQVLTLRGQPLADVTLTISGNSTRTDHTGRFLITSLAAGHQVMLIDGRSASKRRSIYGLFRVGLEVAVGKTNALPFTIWMPKLDMANAVNIPSPNTSEIVITTPLIPGLELHLPPGTVIRDVDGKAVTQISITPVPTDRPPFPLPPGFNVPVFASIQPGGARIIPPRARLIYPNYTSERPGTRISFWNYDPEAKGWYTYGQGTVSSDGRQVVPDPGVVIYEFSGIMISNIGNPPLDAPNAGGGPESRDGDPVDLGTGLFVLNKTDLFLSDTLPLTLRRTYRPGDNTSRAFGIGTNHSYEMFLWSVNNWQETDLILPDGGRIHYARISPGTGWTDAVYEHTSTPSLFYKSRLSWNGSGWDLRLKNGTVYVFPLFAPIQSIRDRYGNRITISRSNGTTGNITQVTSPNGRWIQFVYDSSNRVTQAKDNTGRTVNYTYDAGGRLWKVTDPAGGVTEYTYDTSNRMLTLKDARGIVFLTNEYDTAGRVTKQTQADNSTYQFAYTLGVNGKITQTDVTDPRGNVRRVTFNPNGYTLSEIRALGKPEQQIYSYERQSGTNLILNVTDPLTRTTSFTYDAMGNLASVTRLSGTSQAVTTTITHEPGFNQVASVTDPLNHTTAFGYDPTGNLTSISDPLNHQTTFAYDTAGQRVSVTDPLQHTFQFTYDGGDLIAITDPLGRTGTRALDALGRLISITNPLGQRTRYKYDALNQQTGKTDPVQGVTVFGYDANGNLLSVTDARNNVTSYTYNNMDRAITHRDPLLHDETYQYNPNGNLTQLTDRKGQVRSSGYDALGRLIQVTYADTSTISYTYDSVSRVTQMVDSTSGTITYAYDNLNRLVSEITAQGSISYTYDVAGRRTGMSVPGQTTISYTYDNANRLTEITKGASAVTFAYDNADRRISLTLPNGVVTEFTYDSASQLTGLTYKYGTNTLGNLSYTYDAGGRRVRVGGSYARTGLPQAVTSAAYNAANQQTSFGGQSLTYDLNGNLTGDGTNTYTWNARNQLTSITGGVAAGFSYDGLGRRVTRTVSSISTNYLYDAKNVVQELSGTTPIANLLSGGMDEVFARTDSSGSSAILADVLGSSVALSDSSGVLQTNYTYEPFGNTSTSGTPSTNASQFTGRENDGTGLYYYRARYYSPIFQRFLSQDPLGFGGGDSNLYGYVRNSPLNLVDPIGLDGAPPQQSTPTQPNSSTTWPEIIRDWLLNMWNTVTPMGELTSTLQVGPDAYTTTQILIEQKAKRDEATRCAFGDCTPSDDGNPNTPNRPDSREPSTPSPLDYPKGGSRQQPGIPPLARRKN